MKLESEAEYLRTDRLAEYWKGMDMRLFSWLQNASLAVTLLSQKVAPNVGITIRRMNTIKITERVVTSDNFRPTFESLLLVLDFSICFRLLNVLYILDIRNNLISLIKVASFPNFDIPLDPVTLF